MTKQFIAVVERYPDEGQTTEFRINDDREGEHGEPPLLIYLEYGGSDFDGINLARAGKYAERGERWRYHKVDPLNMTPVEHQTFGQYDPNRLRVQEEGPN